MNAYVQPQPLQSSPQKQDAPKLFLLVVGRDNSLGIHPSPEAAGLIAEVSLARWLPEAAWLIAEVSLAG